MGAKLKVRGASRTSADSKEALLYFNRELTDEEMLRLRDVVEQAMNATDGLEYPIIRAIGAVAEQ